MKTPKAIAAEREELDARVERAAYFLVLHTEEIEAKRRERGKARGVITIDGSTLLPDRTIKVKYRDYEELRRALKAKFKAQKRWLRKTLGRRK